MLGLSPGPSSSWHMNSQLEVELVRQSSPGEQLSFQRKLFLGKESIQRKAPRCFGALTIS